MTTLNKKLLSALSLLLIAALLLGGAAAFADYTAPEYEWPFIKKVPMKPKYTEDVEHHGTVETLRYTTHAYAIEAVAAGNVVSAEDDNPDILPLDKDALCGDQTEFVMEKELLVYLPYGYDPAEKYNVVYALHGTEGDETYWIGDNATGSSTRKMIDRMIDKGECAPFILVTPNYYSIPADKAELFTDWYTYMAYVYNKWVIPLLVAAMLEMYSTHRMASELNKDEARDSTSGAGGKEQGASSEQGARSKGQETSC